MENQNIENSEKTLLEKNRHKILQLYLAFETYNLVTKNEPELMLDVNKDVAEFWDNLKKTTEDENLQKSIKILNKFDKLLDQVGRDNFYFDDDPEGYVEYIGDKKRKDKGRKYE